MNDIDDKLTALVEKFQPAGRTVTIGEFDKEHQAAIAYNVAAYQIYGEDAKLNDIGEDQ
jgi:hypothetical protein